MLGRRGSSTYIFKEKKLAHCWISLSCITLQLWRHGGEKEANFLFKSWRAICGPSQNSSLWKMQHLPGGMDIETEAHLLFWLETPYAKAAGNKDCGGCRNVKERCQLFGLILLGSTSKIIILHRVSDSFHTGFICSYN